jgi:hypothetical protein
MELSTVYKTLFFTSDENSGAQSIGNRGDEFRVLLNTPITIPENAINVRAKVLDSSVWNVVPNISTENLNNTFIVNGQSFTIPDGLYSLTELNITVGRLLDEAGISKLAVQFEPDNATQRVFVNIEQGTTLDLTVSDFNEIIGFDKAVYNQSTLAPNPANFNRTEFFVIESDIALHGLPLNNIDANIIHKHVISAPPGSQSNYAPFNPQIVNMNNLIGQKLNNLSFRLRDQLNRNVDTLGEYFSFTLQLEYDVLTADGNIKYTDGVYHRR